MYVKQHPTSIVAAARSLQRSLENLSRPPVEVSRSPEEPVLPASLFQDTRGYVERVVHQINRTYATTCYDACAVMIRRLVEVLIIEAFEQRGIAHRIKDPDGNYLFLGDLIPKALGEPTWTLGRPSRTGLGKLKTIGDRSAHNRRYNARRSDIDAVIIDLRAVAEEFLYLAGLRK